MNNISVVAITECGLIISMVEKTVDGEAAYFYPDCIMVMEEGESNAANTIPCHRRSVVTADKLQRAREHIASGLSVREAATRLNVGKTSLYAALQRAEITKRIG